MESNKDEAARCVEIAESAWRSGDKAKALKFVKIAKRLDHNLDLNHLVIACEKLDNSTSRNEDEIPVDQVRDEIRNVDRNFTEEHVSVIREIKRTRDYYEILGVEKSCSVDEIRKAYRKLSLKVHPDKNKAPGAEEAFKSVCKAFKCLSDEQSRRNYDQTGLVEDYEFNEQHGNVMRRRRRTARNGLFEEDFDPDEIFRSFFFGTQDDLFRAQRVYQARTMRRQHGDGYEREGGGGGGGGGGFNLVTLLQILPILLFFLVAFIPFSEPQYSMQRTYVHQVLRVTEKHGIEFFVKSEDFDQQFPDGSSARNNLEHSVLRDYKSNLSRYCLMERQRRQWVRNYPMPHCEKLRSLEVA